MTPYYQDDLVTIYHADNRSAVGWVVDDADVLVTDPPYGIGANRMALGNGVRRIDRGDRDWDADRPDLAPWLTYPAVIWGGNYFGLPPSGRWLVWDKGTGDNDYADCELAWTNLPGVVKKYARGWVGANARESGESRVHPTQKPVELMRWSIEFTPPGTVLDPFMGSGSTLVAAKSLNRRAIGIEIEERYCEIAAQRCSQEVLGLAL